MCTVRGPKDLSLEEGRLEKVTGTPMVGEEQSLSTVTTEDGSGSGLWSQGVSCRKEMSYELC